MLNDMCKNKDQKRLRKNYFIVNKLRKYPA